VTSVVVIGDIFYDYVCDLSTPNSQHPADLIANGADLVADVLAVVGGAGLQFAVAAAAVGFEPVTIIGKIGGTGPAGPDAVSPDAVGPDAVGPDAVGRTAGHHAMAPDPAGAAALAAMRAGGVNASLAVDPTAPTGRAMITYLPRDRRLMISDAGANARFAAGDLTPAMVEAVAGARLLYVSGYALVTPTRREAVCRLITGARAAGAAVALDVVPHDFDGSMDAGVVEDVLRSVDWILIAASTARRLVGAITGTSEAEVIASLLRRARSVAIFHHPSTATVVHQGTHHEHRFEYDAGAASRGQSARAQAELLYRYVS